MTTEYPKDFLAKALADIAQLEDSLTMRPPYGYLILGPQCRRAKIENTPERQARLQSLIDEKRAIVANERKALAAPDKKKMGPVCGAGGL